MLVLSINLCGCTWKNNGKRKKNVRNPKYLVFLYNWLNIWELRLKCSWLLNYSPSVLWYNVPANFHWNWTGSTIQWFINWSALAQLISHIRFASAWKEKLYPHYPFAHWTCLLSLLCCINATCAFQCKSVPILISVSLL